MKKLLTPIVILAFLLLSGCAELKPIAKTALEVAEQACAFYATQTGFSVKDACATEKQLRPFLDALLAAQVAAAASKPTSPCPECIACPEVKAGVQPVASSPPVPTPPPATATPISTPAPEKK